MRERPILFSGPMVRAILAGQKTQTRRVVKPQPDMEHNGEPYWYEGGYRAWEYRKPANVPERNSDNNVVCPFGQPGDRLWVRESYRVMRPHGIDEVQYKADWKPLPHDGWKSSIHMPRWASRLTLEITDVRVERLQDITEEDALAEGIAEVGRCQKYVLHLPRYHWNPLEPCDGDTYDAPSMAFSDLWDSINAKRGHGWDTNPFVWVVTFKQVTP